MRKTRIISLGDIPDFPTYQTKLVNYVNTGFDGLVLAPTYGANIPIYLNVWGTTTIPFNTVTPLWNTLTTPPSNNLSHNYLRTDVVPGNIDWFDPAMTNIQANMVGLAQLSRASFCRGIFMDTEPYQGQLWNYQGQPQQGSHSFGQYQTQVKSVATAMGLAMWAVFPSCIFFITGNYCDDVCDTGHPADHRQYGLFSSFLDGLLDSMAGYPCASLVIGNEFSFACNGAGCFSFGVSHSKVAPYVGSSLQFPTHATIAMATNVTNPSFTNGPTGANYFTPTGLTSTLILASQYTDKYLWVYTGGYGWVINAGSGILSSDYTNSILNALPLVV